MYSFSVVSGIVKLCREYKYIVSVVVLFVWKSFALYATVYRGKICILHHVCAV